jgi:hypothetical protein
MSDHGGSAGASRVFDSAHDAMLRHSDIQFTFPALTIPPVPEWIKWLGRVLLDYWPLIEWMLWIGAAAIVLWIVVSLVRQYWPLLMRGRQKEEPRKLWPAEEPWRPTVAQARRLLAEADELARQGRYSEAVHVLLLRSIEDIEERRPRLLRRALTSREIGVLRGLPEAARPAFQGIAHAVERSRFAGHAVDAEAFRRCRGDYEAFALAPVWQAAA